MINIIIKFKPIKCVNLESWKGKLTHIWATQCFKCKHSLNKHLLFSHWKTLSVCLFQVFGLEFIFLPTAQRSVNFFLLRYFYLQKSTSIFQHNFKPLANWSISIFLQTIKNRKQDFRNCGKTKMFHTVILLLTLPNIRAENHEDGIKYNKSTNYTRPKRQSGFEPSKLNLSN